MLTVYLLVYLFVLQVDSKFLVGLGGILVVSCAVLSSLGFCSWIGIPSSLIIVQVVPFLVLAVGADNIFIFVLEYQVWSVVPKFWYTLLIILDDLTLLFFLCREMCEGLGKRERSRLDASLEM